VSVQTAFNDWNIAFTRHHGGNVEFGYSSQGILFPVSILGHERFRAENTGSFHYRLFERKMLKGMQRVVMYENADRALCGE
jgi:hypothetical protein